jgi:hypothetical protein
VSEIRDFTHVKNFPGTLDNEFDIILRRFESIQNIPNWIFILILIFISLIAGYGRWTFSLIVLGFLLLDWLLLYLLPKYGRSYGPAKPPVLVLALLRLPFALIPQPISILVQTIGTCLVIYGFWIEPHSLKVTTQNLVTPKLPTNFRFSMLHLSDLHLERVTRREKDLLRVIQELKPDLIVFTGDILNLSYVEDPVAIEQARRIIGQWQAPLGIYVVSGSEAVDLKHIFPEIIKELPLQWLNSRSVEITKDRVSFRLTGIHCSHRPFVDAPILDEHSGSGGNEFNILLYHSPDLAPHAAAAGYDLQLSGHTHGGQVCLPIYGPLFTASLYGRRFQSGRYQLGNLVLYISRGIGMEGKAAPRVRFLCPPEVIFWEISGSAQPDAHQGKTQ